MINFRNYPAMTKCVIPDGVILSNTNFQEAFNGMKNLRTVSLPNSVTDLTRICYNCTNLTTPVCGPNVTSMSWSYFNCTNLTTPVCGPNVTSMPHAYQNCRNLTTAVCGPNVTSMDYAYFNCTNLTTPVCGPNVTSLYFAYQNCRNLTTAVCGPNVTSMRAAYSNCYNICGNFYVYSNSVDNFRECFRGRNASNMLNIYVHAGTTSNIALTNITNSLSLAGVECKWTTDSANSCKYNVARNIYIYYVNDVDAVRKANGDPDYMGNM